MFAKHHCLIIHGSVVAFAHDLTHQCHQVSYATQAIESQLKGELCMIAGRCAPMQQGLSRVQNQECSHPAMAFWEEHPTFGHSRTWE